MKPFGTDSLAAHPFHPTLPSEKKPSVLAIAFTASDPTKCRFSRNGFVEYSFACVVPRKYLSKKGYEHKLGQFGTDEFASCSSTDFVPYKHMYEHLSRS